LNMSTLAVTSFILFTFFIIFALVQVIAYASYFVIAVKRKKILHATGDSPIQKQIPLSKKFIIRLSTICGLLLISNILTILFFGLVAVDSVESGIVKGLLVTFGSIGDNLSAYFLLTLALYMCYSIVKTNHKMNGGITAKHSKSITTILSISGVASFFFGVFPASFFTFLLFFFINSEFLQAMTSISLKVFNLSFIFGTVFSLVVSLLIGFKSMRKKLPQRLPIQVDIDEISLEEQPAGEQSTQSHPTAGATNQMDGTPDRIQKLKKKNNLLMTMEVALVCYLFIHVGLESSDWRFLSFKYQPTFFVFVFGADRLVLLGLLCAFLLILHPKFNIITTKKFSVDEQGDRISFRQDIDTDTSHGIADRSPPTNITTSLVPSDKNLQRETIQPTQQREMQKPIEAQASTSTDNLRRIEITEATAEKSIETPPIPPAVETQTISLS